MQSDLLLYRMAPPKGGTDPPDAKFMAVATVVVGAGYYSWFIHKEDEKDGDGGDGE